MGISPIPRTPVIRPWFNRGNRGIQLPSGATLGQYATFLDEFNYAQIGSENLLKAPDDLTNTTYWTHSNTAISDQGSGVFRITADDVAASDQLYQAITNWVPEWIGAISHVIEVRAVTATEVALAVTADASFGTGFIGYEKISGPGTLNNPGGYLRCVGLETDQWTKLRVSYNHKGWAASVTVNIYPDGFTQSANAIEVRNSQVILGDQPDEKPRPVDQETAYPMMAYRPHWRLTRDGAARCSVVDTEGLIWNGEATDIKVNPSSTSTFACNADSIVNMSFTFEVGQYVILNGRHTDPTHLGWSIYCKTGGDLVVEYDSGAGRQELYENFAFFADGVAYRLRVEVEGTSLKLYVDDKLMTTETLTYNLTVALAYIKDTHAGVIKVASESNPKRPGLIVAGGKAAPAYGDPGFVYTMPDGSAFTGASGTAVLGSFTHYEANRILRFGMADTTIPAPEKPYVDSGGGDYRIRSAGTHVPDPIVIGTEDSLMILNRSNTRAHHFLRHDSGKQWKLWWVEDEEAIESGPYPSLLSYSAPLFVSRIALLDLSSWVDGDFAEVTYEASSPPNGAQFVIDADFHTRVTHTTENGKDIYFYCRYIGGTHYGIRVNVQVTAGQLTLWERTPAGGQVSLYHGGGVISDGVEYQIDVVAEGSLCSLYLDNVLKWSGTADVNTDIGKARIYNDLTVNDIEFETHPNPALGLATSRIVAPQDAETYECESDMLMYRRNIILPSSNGNYFSLRGSNNLGVPWCYGWRISDDGGSFVYDYEAAGYELNVGAGAYSDNEDASLVAEGSDMEFFTDGVSLGSSASADKETNTGGKVLQIVDGGPDAVENWPRLPKLPFKL